MAIGDITYIDDRATGANDGSSPEDAYTDPSSIGGGSLSAGEIVDFAEGSGPYIRTALIATKGNGTAANPVIWRGNKCEINCGIDLSTISGGEWNLSPSGTNEYYFTLALKADPSISSCDSSTVDGHYYERSSEDDDYQRGTVGSLANGQLGYGSNAEIGFNTVHVRFDDLAPLDHTVICSQNNFAFDGNHTDQLFTGFMFKYCNGYPVSARGASGTWIVENCVSRYADDQMAASTAAGALVVRKCIGFFTGHKLAAVTNAAANLSCYNNIAIKSHIFALTATASTATLNVYNNIGYKLTSGVLDTAEAAGITVNEDYNFWYVDWPTGAAATPLDYSIGGSPVWTTTGANSIPASLSTSTTNTLAEMEAGGSFLPLLSDPLADLDNVSDETLWNLMIANDSLMIGKGGAYWGTDPNPVDINGEPYSNFDTDLGPVQSFYGPFHPVNL